MLLPKVSEEVCKLLRSEAISSLEIDFFNLKSEVSNKVIEALMTNRSSLKLLKASFFKQLSNYCSLLCNFLKNNQSLKVLELRATEVSESLLQDICHAITEARGLRKVILGLSGLEGNFQKSMSHLLAETRFTEGVFFSFSSIRPSGLASICQSLMETNNVKELVFEFGEIRDVGCVTKLCPMLLQNGQLESLDLGQNSLTDAGVSQLCSTLRSVTSLTALKLDNNPLKDNGCLAVAALTSHHRNLCHIDVSLCHLSANGLRSFCEVLKSSNSIVRSLVLSRNLFGEGGCAALRDLLRTNTSLQSLDVSLNGIGTKGLVTLCEGLTNSTLTHLDVSRNQVEDFVLSTTTTTSSLKSLHFDGNRITQAGVHRLCQWLEKNKGTLERLSFSGNVIGAEGARAVARELKQCHALRYLNMSACRAGVPEMFCAALRLDALIMKGNNVSKSDVDAICYLLRTNAVLKELDLRNNDLSSAGMDALLDAVQQNGSLLEVYLPCSEEQRSVADLVCLRNRQMHERARESSLLLFVLVSRAFGKDCGKMIAQCLLNSRTDHVAWAPEQVDARKRMKVA